MNCLRTSAPPNTATAQRRPAMLKAFDADVSVIVHCKSGFRAALSAPVLGVLGFDNFKVFNGSYKAWVEAGEPVVTG